MTFLNIFWVIFLRILRKERLVCVMAMQWCHHTRLVATDPENELATLVEIWDRLVGYKLLLNLYSTSQMALFTFRSNVSSEGRSPLFTAPLTSTVRKWRCCRASNILEFISVTMLRGPSTHHCWWKKDLKDLISWDCWRKRDSHTSCWWTIIDQSLSQSSPIALQCGTLAVPQKIRSLSSGSLKQQRRLPATSSLVWMTFTGHVAFGRPKHSSETLLTRVTTFSLFYHLGNVTEHCMPTQQDLKVAFTI